MTLTFKYLSQKSKGAFLSLSSTCSRYVEKLHEVLCYKEVLVGGQTEWLNTSYMDPASSMADSNTEDTNTLRIAVSVRFKN